MKTGTARSAAVYTRFRPFELAAVRQAAAQRGEYLSEFIRERVLASLPEKPTPAASSLLGEDERTPNE
jgi:hypothetical protein